MKSRESRLRLRSLAAYSPLPIPAHCTHSQGMRATYRPRSTAVKQEVASRPSTTFSRGPSARPAAHRAIASAIHPPAHNHAGPVRATRERPATKSKVHALWCAHTITNITALSTGGPPLAAARNTKKSAPGGVSNGATRTTVGTRDGAKVRVSKIASSCGS